MRLVCLAWICAATLGNAYFIWHSQGEGKVAGEGCRLVCSQHKCGTFNMLQAVDAYHQSVPSLAGDEERMQECRTGDMAFFLNIEKMQKAVGFDYSQARGVLMIRHPLDMLVSAHRFHLMSKEAWLHVQQDNGLTYQEELQLMDKTAGIMHELTKGAPFQDLTRLLDFMESPAAEHLQRLKLETSKYSPVEFADQFSLAMGFDKERMRSIIVEDLAYEKFTAYKHLSSVDADLIEEIRQLDLHGAAYPYEFALHLECVHYEAFEELFGVKSLKILGYGDSIQMYKAARLEQCGPKTKKHKARRKKGGKKKKKSRRQDDSEF
jgi:hypothetical protein